MVTTGRAGEGVLAGSLVDMGDMLVWKKFLVERNMSFGPSGSGFESSSAPPWREVT